MTILQELLQLNESASLADAAMAAFKAFKNSSQKQRHSTMDEPAPKGTSIEFGVRDWGTWQVPADDEDDGDYDWQEPTVTTMEAAKALLNGVEKQFPKYKFTMHSGEKNWLYISVKAK
jgi:hypothetical protein